MEKLTSILILSFLPYEEVRPIKLVGVFFGFQNIFSLPVHLSFCFLFYYNKPKSICYALHVVKYIYSEFYSLFLQYI